MICNTPIFCNNEAVVTPLSEGVIFMVELIFIALFLSVLLYLFKKKHKKTIKSMLIALIGVILFELMIEPMVTNARFSSWTYYFHDMSFIVTLGWVLIVTISITLVDFAFPKTGNFKKFWLYLCTIDVLTLPIEVFLVQTGMRVYSESLMATTLGPKIPFTIVPVEIAFAIPMFFALVIGFTKYWEIVFKLSR